MADTASDLILRLALQNAVKYNGKASRQAVIGKVLAADPGLKGLGNELYKLVDDIIAEVNSMKIEEQRRKLEEIAPELLVEKKKEEVRRLQVLKNVDGRVVMRFAPNPNGPLSLGHARPALLNWFYVKEYKGRYILRYDDTDPGKVKPAIKEAYKWILDDLKWLGVKPAIMVKASSRLKIYYKYAEKLIKMGKAYVCSCQAELKSQLLVQGKGCLCRDFPISEQEKRWKKMLSKTGYREGEAVLRIKTNLADKNPAVRDWVAFRIIDECKHPLKNAKVWPLLNFNSAIDDHDLKVTHIVRGIDLAVSDDRQKYIYDYLGWRYPETMYNGKLFVSGIRSTSEADKMIKNGELSGWDDPRLGTLMALRRRGFQAEAINRFIFDLGLNKSDVNVSIDTLAAYNKAIVEKKANRYFFVDNPIRIEIADAPKLEAKLPLHPDDAKRGFRRLQTNGSFYIRDSLSLFKTYRLIGLFNFKNKKFLSKEYDEKLNAGLIHWVPASDNIKAEVVMTDNARVKGLIESNASKIKAGDIVQLYRFGFCRLDSKEDNKLVFYYGHG